jgi:hypothetical protein
LLLRASSQWRPAQAGEKRKEEEVQEKTNQAERARVRAARQRPLASLVHTHSCRPQVENRELKEIVGELSALHHAGELSRDGASLYLYGVCLSELGRAEQAVPVLCQSVAAFPWCVAGLPGGRGASR